MKIIDDQKEVIFDLIVDFIGQRDEKRFSVLLNGLQAV